MRKVLILALAVGMIEACNPSNNKPGESGAVNDGINAVDSNGGLADTGHYPLSPATDTAKMEDRTDVSTRDTAK